jgi:hypothetical protein
MLAQLLVIRSWIVHQEMRKISRLIWILITLLITATVDRLPDPPAAKPAGVQLTIVGPQELPPAFGAPARCLAAPQMQEPDHLTVSDTSERLHPTDWIVPLERGTDPSPPLLIS